MMRHSKKVLTLALAAAMAVSSASLAFAMPGDVGKCLDSSVSSEPAVISDAWWNDSVASWNYTGKCDHFEVQLFRNSDLVQTETTIASEFDFIEALTDEGDYTFQVRPVIQDQTSEWTTTSNTYLSRPGQPTHIHADGHRASIAPLDDKTPGVSTGMTMAALSGSTFTQMAATLPIPGITSIAAGTSSMKKVTVRLAGLPGMITLITVIKMVRWLLVTMT